MEVIKMEHNLYELNKLTKQLFKDLYKIYNKYRDEMLADPNITFDLYKTSQIAHFVPQDIDYYEEEYVQDVSRFLKQTQHDDFDLSKPFFLYEYDKLTSISYEEAFDYISFAQETIEKIEYDIENA